MWNKFRKSRYFYILLSVICAILCWLYVDVAQEPRTPRTIRNIPVQMTGIETLTRQGLMIEDDEAPTLSLTFTGVRTEISRLNRNNVYVSVDLSGCKEGRQELGYTVTYDSSLNVNSVRVRSTSQNRIPVNIVKMSSKTISVEGVFEGQVAEGFRYNSKDFSATPNKVTITGQDSLVKQVDHAQAVLSEPRLDKTWKGILPLRLVDANGAEVDASSLTISPETVTASFPVTSVRTIGLTVTLEEGGGATAEDVSVSVAPESIKVSGTQEALSGMDSDTFSVGTIDLSQVITTSEQSFPIELPKGLTNISGSVAATVTVKMNSRLSTRKVTIRKKHIRLKNVPEGLSAEVLTEDLEVRIRGAAESMALLVPGDVYAEVDLSDVSAGTEGEITLPAAITVKGMSELGSIDKCEVTLDLREE